MKPLRILIADDHEVVRQGLRTLLGTEPGWKIVGEATTGREAVEKSRQLRPDIVVLDITMPELDGLEATHQIRESAPETQILILTMHESRQAVARMLTAGARGFVLKSDAGRNLIAAVKALSEGQPFLGPRISEIMLQDYRAGARRERETSDVHLTPREHQIVQLLAEGKTSKEVARLLGMSAKTVETHRSHLMTKLKVHSIGELIRHAIHTGLVKP